MKRIALITATILMLATSATAGGTTFPPPNLSLPPTADVVLNKDCLSPDAATGLYIEQE